MFNQSPHLDYGTPQQEDEHDEVELRRFLQAACEDAVNALVKSLGDTRVQITTAMNVPGAGWYFHIVTRRFLTTSDASLLVDQILFLSRVSKAIPEAVPNIEQLILLPDANASAEKTSTRRRAVGGPQRSRQVHTHIAHGSSVN